MKDSINNENTRKAATRQQVQYEYETKEKALKAEQDKKDAIAEEEKHQEAIIRNSLIAGFTLVLILGLVILRGYRLKQKANIIIEKQKKEVELQKHIVEEKQKEILDSIHYANRIQKALFANHEMLKKNIPDNFVFFKPKDIVSGDFYWAAEHNNKFYIAVCDSTGHGVPGAFMCLLNIGFLNEAIKEKDIMEPNEVFNYVRKRLIASIAADGQKDGFDGILLCMDKNNNQITYASAYNQPILVSDNQLIGLETDKMPVGEGQKSDSFTNFTLNCKKGDTVYLYTDGYADQFGGEKGKKFKYKTLNELLLSNSSTSMESQKENLGKVFENWKGPLEQVDDVLVIGIKI